MRRKSEILLLFLSAAVLLALGFTTNGTRAADGSKITVAYSGNLLGYSEPCG
ncbi:MAG: hypothetical protein LBT74_00745 [Acidobacteriota bacterium]|jgi:hypothetical protein|nr:hypothetical protein [Acidobacteriota bacterium]